MRATRVVMQGNRAVGIAGELKTFTARAQTIISAGALQSPRLLMLSGIGDGEELRKFGMPVVRHLPGVGRNLRDQVDYVFSYRTHSLDLFGITPGGGLRLIREIRR